MKLHIKSLDFHKHSKQLLAAGVAALMLATITATGIHYAVAATPSLSVSPSSDKFTRGSVVSIQIKSYSETPLNAVQANLTYSTSTLEVVGISYEGSAYDIEAQGTYGNGQISLGRANISGVTGSQLVGTVSFKVLKNGKADVSFAPASALVTAADSRNILGTTTDGYYKVR